MMTRIHMLFSVASSLVIVLTIVLGVSMVGSPEAARLMRFDQQRLADLRTIFREIQFLCHDPELKAGLKRPLPKSLEELAQQARNERINLRDPESGQPYQYSVKGETTYEVCATFSLERDSDEDVFWNHPPGEHCFTIDVRDPP